MSNLHTEIKKLAWNNELAKSTCKPKLLFWANTEENKELGEYVLLFI